MVNLEEAINRYERQTEELYNAIPCDGCAFNTCKKEHRQLAEWLKELQRWREFGGRIANVCASYITEEQKEKLLEIMEVNSDEIHS